MNDNLRFAYLVFIVLSEIAALMTGFLFVKHGIYHAMLLAYGLYPGCYFWARDLCKDWSQQKKDNVVLLVMLFLPLLFFKDSGLSIQQFLFGSWLADFVAYFMMKLWAKYPFPKDR